MRLDARLAWALAISMTPSACGRTPLFSAPVLFVQVVDESGDGVPRADIELRGLDDDGEPVVAHAHADSDGVASFAYPGAGRYDLRATTDWVCCAHEGTLATTVTGPNELVVVETVTGLCPTWVPTSCL
ncbi:MAG TPA: carboxypeptidase-like regulatory domain-containing protein [Nannocystaceae bacterium]|nr:carboxypeptidase-like regulatory domain-containing protein [Nannocystaceae bacterium]